MTIICLIGAGFSQHSNPLNELFQPISEQGSFSEVLLSALHLNFLIQVLGQCWNHTQNNSRGPLLRRLCKMSLSINSCLKLEGLCFILSCANEKSEKIFSISDIKEKPWTFFLSHALLLLHIPHKFIFTIPSVTNFFYFWEQKWPWNAFVCLAISRCIKLLLHKRICTLHWSFQGRDI